MPRASCADRRALALEAGRQESWFAGPLIAVDPGKTGAVVWRFHDASPMLIADLADVPTPEAFRARYAPFQPQRAHAIVEATPTFAFRGTIATMKLAHCAGLWVGGLQVMLGAHAVAQVQPAVWKRALGLDGEAGGGKAGALALARSLFPDNAAQLRRAKDHNRAEALLLSYYARYVKQWTS